MCLYRLVSIYYRLSIELNWSLKGTEFWTEVLVAAACVLIDCCCCCLSRVLLLWLVLATAVLLSDLRTYLSLNRLKGTENETRNDVALPLLFWTVFKYLNKFNWTEISCNKLWTEWIIVVNVAAAFWLFLRT